MAIAPAQSNFNIYLAGPEPGTLAAICLAKILCNKARDRRVNRELRAKGWTVIRIWEHELAKKNIPRLLKRLSVLQG